MLCNTSPKLVKERTICVNPAEQWFVSGSCLHVALLITAREQGLSNRMYARAKPCSKNPREKPRALFEPNAKVQDDQDRLKTDFLATRKLMMFEENRDKAMHLGKQCRQNISRTEDDTLILGRSLCGTVYSIENDFRTWWAKDCLMSMCAFVTSPMIFFPAINLITAMTNPANIDY